MKKTPWIPFAALLGLLAFSGPARAQEIVIKLGTLAPVGSPWHLLLKEGAQAFTATSGGRVTLRIFAGGTMGNEGDMVKKMRIGQLHAAALSTVGLHEITPEPLALDLPLLVQNREELTHLLEKIGPKLEAKLLEKGYVVMNWSEIGFTRFFSTKARPTLAEMRQSKVFSWEGDPASAEAWKAGGFHPVVLSSTDIIPSLTTGLIDAVVYPPTYALALRLNDKAKFMQDLVWSSFTGAMVVDRKTWEKIPPDLRPALQKITRELGGRTVEKARQMEDEALTKMKAQGLTVVHVPDAPEWHKAVAATTDKVRGTVVPAATFDEVYRIVKEFRASRKGAK
jgi:TRAP-type transport system periplasmic protein